MVTHYCFTLAWYVPELQHMLRRSPKIDVHMMTALVLLIVQKYVCHAQVKRFQTNIEFIPDTNVYTVWYIRI